MDPSSPTPSTSPREIINAGIIHDSISEVRHGIAILKTQSRRGFDPNWALSLAIKHARPSIVRYLLDEGDATVDSLTPLKVSYVGVFGEPQIDRIEKTLEVVVEKGWDINMRERVTGEDSEGTTVLYPGESLLSLICHNERLVRWCLTHGATTEEPPDLEPFYTPPLLETVASKGSILTLKLLLESGARLGRRSLHHAAQSAAYAEEETRVERMAMMKFLVEECGCDVNSMDVPEGQTLPDHWGTPAAYAVQAHGDGAPEVVAYLLEKGANLRIKDCSHTFDALSLAKSGSEDVRKLLKIWEMKNPQVPERYDQG